MTQWRPYRPDDGPALRALHRRQCEAAGERTMFPDLEDPRFLATLVAERDGQVVGAASAHATCELVWISADATLLVSLARQWEDFRRRLRGLGCDEVHVFERRETEPKLQRLLHRLGLRRLDEYAVYYGRV